MEDVLRSVVGFQNIGDMFRDAITNFLNSGLGIKTLQSGIIRVIGTGLAFAVSVLLARILGADGLGIYAGAMALISLLIIPAASGLPLGLVQLVSRYLAANQHNHARGIIRWSFGQVLGAGLIVAGIGAGITLTFYFTEQSSARVYLLAFALLPILCLTSIQRGILNALECSSLSLFPQDIIRPGVLAVALLIWVVFWPENRGNPATAMTLQFSAFVVAFLAGVIFLRRFGSRKLPQGPRNYEFGRWYRVSLQFMTAGAAALVLSQTDLIMLSWMEPPSSAGLYRVGSAIALLIMFPYAAVNVPLAPAIARYFEVRNMDEFQRIVTLVVRWAFAGCFPLAVVLILGGKPLLSIIYGKEFAAAYGILVVLSLAQLFHAAAGPVGVILDMTGYQLVAAKGLFVAAGVNVVLNAILIPPFGPMGAAYATAASIVLWNAILLYRVISTLNINPTILRRNLS